MEQRRFLLLGGSGYLGSEIDQQAKNIMVGQWLATCYTAFLHPELVPLDVTDERKVAKIADEYQPDVVIWSLMSAHDETDLMERGLQNVLRHIAPKAKLVYLSSDGIFGQGTGGFTEADEGTPLDPINPLAAYTRAKIDAEKLIRMRHPNHVIVRFGPIYGKNQSGTWDKRTIRLMADWEARAPLERSTNVYKTFVHVSDLAAGILELSSGSFTGTIHLGPETKESYYTFTQKIAVSLGMPSSCIKEGLLTQEEARSRGIPLDTSLDTSLARRILRSKFRSV